VLIDNAQDKNGTNPASSPSQKNLLSNIFFFIKNSYLEYIDTK